MTDPWDDFSHRRSAAREPEIRETYAFVDAGTCLEEWAKEMIWPGLCDQMSVNLSRIDGGWVATASWSIMGFWRHASNMSPDPIPAADGLIRNTNIEQQCLFRPRHKAVGLRTFGVERMARVLYEERAQHRASSGTHQARGRHG